MTQIGTELNTCPLVEAMFVPGDDTTVRLFRTVWRVGKRHSCTELRVESKMRSEVRAVMVQYVLMKVNAIAFSDLRKSYNKATRLPLTPCFTGRRTSSYIVGEILAF